MEIQGTGHIDAEQRTIGWAVKQLHNGSKVARSGWNGKGQYLILVSSAKFHLTGDQPNPPEYTEPFVAIKNAQGKYVPWFASQTDLLAIDYEIAE